MRKLFGATLLAALLAACGSTTTTTTTVPAGAAPTTAAATTTKAATSTTDANDSGYGYGGYGSPGTTAAGSSSTASGGAAAGSGGGTDLVLFDLKFTPSSVPVKAGQSITLKLTNNDSFAHNLTIASLNINQDVQAGQSMPVTVNVPANATGNIEFHCRFHASSGMTGNLTVG